MYYFCLDFEKQAIRTIRRMLDSFGGVKKYIIYPFGMQGKIAKSILNTYFGIDEYLVVDNMLSKSFDKINSVNELTDEDIRDAIVLMTSNNMSVYDDIRKQMYEKVSRNQCIELTHKPVLVFTPGRAYHGEEGKGVKGTLDGELYDVALRETVEYVAENMADVRSFSNRFDQLDYALMEAQKTDGLYLEFGVYKGESINFMSQIFPFLNFYGFDSFEGLPKNWGMNANEGYFSLNGRMPEVSVNVKLIKGWFEETLPYFLKEHDQPVAFIHIDCDLYSSTKTVLDYLADRIHPGTVICFDEYFNRPGWKRCEYKAFQEFIKDKDMKYEYIGYVGGTAYGCQVAVRVL